VSRRNDDIDALNIAIESMQYRLKPQYLLQILDTEKDEVQSRIERMYCMKPFITSIEPTEKAKKAIKRLLYKDMNNRNTKEEFEFHHPLVKARNKAIKFMTREEHKQTLNEGRKEKIMSSRSVLGLRAKDMATGYKGVITAVTTYWGGGAKYCIENKKSEKWIDEWRAVLID
jgi:hypothetical protein